MTSQSAVWSFALTLAEWVNSTKVDSTSDQLQERTSDLCARLFDAFRSDQERLRTFLRANGVDRADLADELLTGRHAHLANEWRERLERLSTIAGAHAVVEDPWERQLDALLRPFLDESRSMVGDTISQIHHRGEREWKEAACRVVMLKTPQRLRSLVTGPFVLQMSGLQRDLPRGREGYTAAINRFSADSSAWLAFMAGYPVMSRLLLTTAEHWARTSEELIARLWTDRSDLATWLGVSDLAVTDVQADRGDVHLSGSVLELTVNETIKVFYKPRPLAIADGFAKLASHIDDLDPKWRICDLVPEVLSRGDYGWLKAVTPATFTSDALLADYYERLGHLGALAWLLNSVDLHCFNVMPTDRGPVLLDLETLLTPSGIAQSERAVSPLEQAASGTGVLPTISSIAGTMTGTDFSAFGAIAEKTSFTERVWQDPGTTSMRLSLRPGTLTPLSQPESSAGLVDPHRFHDAFMHGFTRMLEFAGEHRTGLLQAAAASLQLEGAPIRVLLRPTAEYGRFLADSLHPGYLSDQILREFHLSWLWRNRPDGVSDAVLAAELNALLVDDVVPYFWTYANSTDLFIGSNRLEPNFFDRSAWDIFRDRLNSLSSRVISRLEWSARAALTAGALERAPNAIGSCCADVPPQPGKATGLVDAAAAILLRLADLAYPSDGSQTWLDLCSSNGTLWRIDTIDDSLYRGSVGMYVAFDQAARFFRRRRGVGPILTEIADDLWRAVIRKVGRSDQSLVGAYEGLGGYLYAVTSSYPRRPEAGDTIDGLLEAIAINEPDGESDVSRGAAGAILSLTAAASRLPEPHRAKALQIAAACGDALLEASHAERARRHWHTVDGLAIAGFAHGSAGITLALRRLADGLADTDARAAFRFLSAAREGERWEGDHYDAQAKNWVDLRPMSDDVGPRFSAGWCNGSAGIGLARLVALRLGTTDQSSRAALCSDLAAALQSSRQGLGRGQTLCHGDLGIALLHFEAGRHLRQRQPLGFARRVGMMVAADVLDHRGAVKSGIRHIRDTPALMNGGAGVALGLLRLVSPQTIPNPLLVDLAG